VDFKYVLNVGRDLTGPLHSLMTDRRAGKGGDRRVLVPASLAIIPPPVRRSLPVIRTAHCALALSHTMGIKSGLQLRLDCGIFYRYRHLSSLEVH